jgi:nucleoid-associated protein YgaU
MSGSEQAMPVGITSRYYNSPVYAADDAHQVSHPTIAIRPPTPPAAGVTIYSHLVTGVETIEYLAWRYYGNSALWWQIAEANDLQYPINLVVGSSINIPGANDLGTVVRNRSFG